jgi:ATP-binding protein involved in chromosome partitioning
MENYRMTDALVTEQDVQKLLDAFKDPESGRSITQLGQVHDLTLDEKSLAVTLGLTTWAAPLWEETRAELAKHLQNAFPKLDITVELAVHERPAEKMGEFALAAKTVIAVGAGKGGVGKSSIALLLAYGLSRAGCKVGVLDADLYGPSIPHLVGTLDKPDIVDEKVQPVMVDGLKVMSMGFFIPDGEAVIWRGPMLHGAITQFLRDTDWGDLDYLVIDMPPGTGDVALSVSQLLPQCETMIVCTPQDVALLDATKAIAMMRRIELNVLGMVENMSFFVCPDCEHRHEIFGCGGAKRKAAEMDVPFLGELPLLTHVRELGDEGKLGSAFDDEASRAYLEKMCVNTVRELSASRRKKPPMPELPILE